MASAGVIPGLLKLNHNIKDYLDLLTDGKVGDQKLTGLLSDIRPYVESLAAIDDYGQELRYHMNRDKQESLSDRPLANIAVIHDSVLELSEIIRDLKYRTEDFLSERTTGTYTDQCSRSDLKAIAELLPPESKWNDPIFDERKDEIKKRFNLGSNQFSRAFEKIKASREFASIAGIEKDLIHLSDDKILRVTELWRTLHPRRDRNGGTLGLNYFNNASERFEDIQRHSETLREVVAVVEAELSLNDLAELEAIFYLGRDGTFAEHYEAAVERTIKIHTVASNPREEICHLFEKTNFLTCLQRACSKLGRLSLSKKLSDF